MIRYCLIAIGLIFMIAACSHSSGTTSASPVAASSESGTHGFSDPFAYCRAVGMIDHPDARYTGPDPPSAVIAGLIKAFGVQATATNSQAFTRGSFWRCMDGKVYACNVGANLPCEAKANTNRTPTPGERKFCGENPGSGFIPMYVTGHDTIYDWRCEGARPVAGKTLSDVDQRGYISNIWYPIPPPPLVR